jgi:cell division protein ZapA
MTYTLPIKLKIADREYPMQVAASEEGTIRAAGREINQAIKNYREEFHVDNHQDLLAMFAVDCMMQKKSVEQEKTDLQNIILKKIDDLENLLNTVL